MAASEFWKLPVGIYVFAPDEALPDLDRRASQAACDGWGLELDGDGIHFRFADAAQAAAFLIGLPHSARWR